MREKKEKKEKKKDFGFAYEWDLFSCGMHGTGDLHTIQFGDGQWVSKGYTVWFSIDK